MYSLSLGTRLIFQSSKGRLSYSSIQDCSKEDECVLLVRTNIKKTFCRITNITTLISHRPSQVHLTRLSSKMISRIPHPFQRVRNHSEAREARRRIPCRRQSTCRTHHVRGWKLTAPAPQTIPMQSVSTPTKEKGILPRGFAQHMKKEGWGSARKDRSTLSPSTHN